MKVPVEMGYLQKTRTEWLKMGWWGSDGCRSIKSALFALHILSSSVANLSKHSYNKKKKAGMCIVKNKGHDVCRNPCKNSSPLPEGGNKDITSFSRAFPKLHCSAVSEQLWRKTCSVTHHNQCYRILPETLWRPFKLGNADRQPGLLPQPCPQILSAQAPWLPVSKTAVLFWSTSATLPIRRRNTTCGFKPVITLHWN